MAKNTSLVLAKQHDKFIKSQVRKGRFGSASEAVRAGLRLLDWNRAIENNHAALTRIVAATMVCVLLLAGMAAAQMRRPLDITIFRAFGAGKLRGLHAVLVIFQGETLAEVYFDGNDKQLDQQLGVVHLHDLRSITKSVTALLYGIALADGKVTAPDAPLLAQFPQYADLAGDPMRDSITVGDTLAMKMGTEWNENLPYSNPRNSETAMELSADRYRFSLERPMVAAPGKQWSYNGGAATLIGKLIADGTGMALDNYARDKLFQPLGITQWHWRRGADGAPSAASGLWLTARDLGKIGQLLLGGGMFEGRRVVPRAWLDKLFTPRTSLSGVRYGYFWWLADSTNPRGWVSSRGNELAEFGDWPVWVAGLGNGGQRLSVQPDIGLIVVVLAGNYNNPGAKLLPLEIIEEYIAPALHRRLGK